MRCALFLDWQVAGWREAWSFCCRGIPQSAPQGLFLFGKILLLDPMAPSIQGRACPLTQPTSQARAGTVWLRGAHMAQLSTLPTQHPPRSLVSVGLPLCPYSPPCGFKQPGVSWCCSGLVWQGREPLTQLSPRSPAASPAGVGLVLQLPWSLYWSQGPLCPEAIPLLCVFSVSCVLFGLIST